MDDLIVIDGCAFAEGQFTGVTEEVHSSPLTAFFLTLPGESEGFRECVDNIGKIYDLTSDPQKRLVVARTTGDIATAKAAGKKAVILTFQDPHPIENSVHKLRVFYELGLRVMQMTYNKTNYIGVGCVESIDGGLTDFGRHVLRRMNELGVVADISHCGHRTCLDVLRLSEKPVVISHAGVWALTPNVRNKTDEELKLLRENGGVIGLSSWGPLCWRPEDQCQPSIANFVDHIDYVVNLIGIDHVGFGGDSTLDAALDESGTLVQSALYAPVVEEYNNSVGIDSGRRHAIDIAGSWEIGNVFAELKKRGYSQEDIYKFAGGNFMRVLMDNGI